MKVIMVIEDENDIAEIIRYILEEAGYEVLMFHDLVTPLEVKKIKPDLLLLDEWLPSGFGGSLCLLLKAEATTRHIPIIIMSAHIQVAEIAATSCADDFIPKPFDINVLVAKVTQYISPPGMDTVVNSKANDGLK